MESNYVMNAVKELSIDLTNEKLSKHQLAEELEKANREIKRLQTEIESIKQGAE